MRSRAITATCAVLAGAALSAVHQTSARADEPGFSVRVTAPDAVTAGRSAQTVTAVVTSENRRCRKVRWALLVRSAVPAGQLEVVRVEDDGEFDASRRTEGITTTIVDDALDPGTLCRGRTVTARWQIAFTGPDSGQAQVEARAFDARDTLLTTAGAAVEVRGDTPEEPSPSPSAEASREEAAPAPEEDTGAGAPPAGEAAADDPAAAGATELASEDTAVLGPGLIIGGVFVFLGVLLLLRIRSRSREARRQAQARPTGFYTMPGSPR